MLTFLWPKQFLRHMMYRWVVCVCGITTRNPCGARTPKWSKRQNAWQFCGPMHERDNPHFPKKNKNDIKWWIVSSNYLLFAKINGSNSYMLELWINKKKKLRNTRIQINDLIFQLYFDYLTLNSLIVGYQVYAWGHRILLSWDIKIAPSIVNNSFTHSQKSQHFSCKDTHGKMGTATE